MVIYSSFFTVAASQQSLITLLRVLSALNPSDPSNSAIAIFGAGAVGMAAVFAAAAIKIKTIIAVDLQDSRLELAKSLGATHTVNGRGGECFCKRGSTLGEADGGTMHSLDMLAKIKEICEGPCDYSIDATGAAPCIKAAWEVSGLHHNGRFSCFAQCSRYGNRVQCLGSCGKMIQLGDPGPGNAFSISVHDIIVLSKQYIGLAEGDSNPPEFIPKLIQLHESKKFPLDKISRTFHYSHLDDAIRAMHDGSVIKPIITFA